MSDPTPTPIGAREASDDRVAPARRRRWPALLVGALLAGCIAEAGARSIEPSVPVPDEWASVEIAAKVEQMDERQARHEVGGVVITGTSQSWGLDPQVLIDAGVADVAYNAALPSATAEVQRRWLLEEVVPRLRPDVVVWGVSAPDLSNGGAALAAAYAHARATKEGAVASADRWLAERFALVRLRPVVGSANGIARAMRAKRHEQLPNPRIGDAGQWSGSTHYAMAQSDPAPSAARLLEVGSTVDALRTTVRSLQAQGIEVVLVLLPLPDRTIRSFEHGREDWERTTSRLTSIAAELDVRLLDGAAGTMGDESFRDPAHLDAEASRDVSEMIARAFGGTPPPDLDPDVVAAIAPDATVAPVIELSIPRQGWVQLVADAPLTELDGTLVTVTTVGPGDPEQVRIELYPRRRFARLLDAQGVRIGLPRTLAIDERTLQVEVSGLRAATTRGLRLAVGTFGDGPGASMHPTPAISRADLDGTVAGTWSQAWDLTTGRLEPGEVAQATLSRRGHRHLVWTMPADGWNDELVVTDGAGRTATITFDAASSTLIARGVGAAPDRVVPATIEHLDAGWQITIEERMLPKPGDEEATGRRSVGPRRRQLGAQPKLVEGLDLVLR